MKRTRSARIALPRWTLLLSAALLAAGRGEPAWAITPLNPDAGRAALKEGATPPVPPRFPALLKRSGRRPPPALGTGQIPLLLIDSPNVPFPGWPGTRPEPDFYEELAFAETGKSMKTYFRENSYGAFEVDGSVVGWMESELPYTYYVNADRQAGTEDDHGFDLSPASYNPLTDPYPRNVWGMIMEAVTLADPTIDFSRFDTDGDGFVDGLMVVHAGPGAEQGRGLLDDMIWSHKSNLAQYLGSIGQPALMTDDGVAIGDYVMVPASAVTTGLLGVYVHEYCHVLGLPDLYRTESGTGAQSSVVGAFDLMDFGPWLDGGFTPGHLGAWSKYQLGWIDPIGVSSDPDESIAIEGALLFASAGASDPSGAHYRILANPQGPDWSLQRVGKGEYFLVENRVPGNLDFDQYLRASGLAIWHVDESRPDNNSADAEEHLLTLVQADGEDWTAFDKPLGEPTDLWPPASAPASFTSSTFPNSRLHGGAFSGVEVTNIRRSGQAVEADFSASAIRIGAPYAYPNPLVMDDNTEAAISFVYQPTANGGPAKTAAAPVRVRVYDLSGALVSTISSADGPAVWNCRNESGRLVGSGVYFYVAEAAGEVATGKVAILH